ncbi:MAG TPA: hypothetical protein VMZ05_02430 [Spirochaetota bacterium]|nr:hypothetical protein [Spirochaetota bacterium]
MVDGVAGNEEYIYSYETNKMTLYQKPLFCTINAALVAQTEGWVGMGFKSSVTDGTEILIGYVRDGTQSYTEQIGVGKRHKDEKLPWVRSLVLSESAVKPPLRSSLPKKTSSDSDMALKAGPTNRSLHHTGFLPEALLNRGSLRCVMPLWDGDREQDR